MKHLKTFNIFEAVIVPKEIDKSKRFGSFEDVLDFAREIDIDIVGYDEFFKSLSKADKTTAPKKGGAPFFALFHPERKKPMFVLEDPNFWRIPIFGEILSDVVSHELIHGEQVKRMGDVTYALPSPEELGKYFGDKNEVMAFSWTIANEMRKGRNFEESVSILRDLDRKSGRLGPMSRMVDDIYRNCDDKTIKRYHKYIYMYLQEFFKEEETTKDPVVKKKTVKKDPVVKKVPVDDGVRKTGDRKPISPGGSGTVFY
jgi:hypothetical protein